MIHGGDVESFKKFYDGEIIDFSSNINPLGVPKGLKEFLDNAFKLLNRYPDIKYRACKREISRYLNCEDEEILVGNGAVDIINNFILMFKRTIVFTPCFYEYIKRPKVLQKEIAFLKRNHEFKINIEEISSILKKGDLVIIGNPNNPDGVVLEKEELIKIINLIIEKDAFLLLDEAFYEFANMDYDSIQVLKKMNVKNACVIRAATKFFALPGIRLGYAWTDKDIAKKYEEIELPWSLNIYAAKAAEFIFKDKDYIRKSKEFIKREREYILEELEKIPYIKAFNSNAAFILIKLSKYNEEIMFNHCLKRGIMIRKASNFEALDKSFIRIAVKDRKSNEKLLQCFRELLI